MIPLRELPCRLVLGALWLYKRLISPMLPPSCRFYPTCSDYAVQAFRTLPFFRALRLSAWRLMRCGPWTPGGFDPPPASDEARTARDDCFHTDHAHRPARSRG